MSAAPASSVGAQQQQQQTTAQHQPTLQEYERFHGMLIGSEAAQRCVESFNGHILFMPSRYERSIGTFPRESHLVSPWEVRSLTVVTYYALVIASLTGLSSLLGLTETLDARAVHDDETPDVPRLSSRATPSLEVDTIVLDYLRRNCGTIAKRRGVGTTESTAPSSVKLVRRFEFHFRLAGIRVVMLHFASAGADGEVLRDEVSGREMLHLVEVYEINRVYWLSQAATVGALLAMGGALLTQLN